MNVVTNQYEASHGKLPRGRGWWMFEYQIWTGLQMEPRVVQINGLYSEAKRQAIKEANRHGAYRPVVLTVLPFPYWVSPQVMQEQKETKTMKTYSLLVTVKVSNEVKPATIVDHFKSEVYFGTDTPVYPAVEEITELQGDKNRAYKITALIEGKRYWWSAAGSLTTRAYDAWRFPFEQLDEAIATAKTIGSGHASVINIYTNEVVWNELDAQLGGK